jgi:hypothetical protein
MKHPAENANSFQAYVVVPTQECIHKRSLVQASPYYHSREEIVLHLLTFGICTSRRVHDCGPSPGRQGTLPLERSDRLPHTTELRSPPPCVSGLVCGSCLIKVGDQFIFVLQ